MYIDPIWFVLLVAGYFAFTFIGRKISAAKDTMKSPDKPMAVKLETKKTPRQIMAEAAKATLSCWLWSLLFVVVVVVAVVGVLWLLGV